MKHKFALVAALALATAATAVAQTPQATVTLENGAQLTFSTWTYQSSTAACLDEATNVDGKTIVIPSQVDIEGTTYDVTMVGPYSFYGTGVSEVVIPDVTTDIYFGAFDGCSQLTTVTVGRGVYNIAETAFNECSSLSTFNLNAVNVTDVDEFDGSGVFGGCTSLTTINFGPDVEGFSQDLFFSLNATAELTDINIAAERLIPITTSSFGYSQNGVSITVPCSQLAAYEADAAWSALGTVTADCSTDTTEPAIDTTISGDTMYIVVRDTIHVYDTLHTTVYDTVVRYVDTTFCDTLYLHDTVYIHDTIYIENQAVDAAETSQAKVYMSQGRLVVEGAAEGEGLVLFDMQGRQMLSTVVRTERFEVSLPRGAYLVRLGQRAARKVVVM